MGGWESGKNKAYLHAPSAHRLSNISSQIKKYILHPVSVHIRFTPAHLFSAGVQTMRARICSAFSCDVFARVVV